MYVSKISFGLMMVGLMMRHAFGLMQEAHLLWTRDRSLVNWKEFVRCQVRANKTCSEAKRQFSDRNMDVFMNIQSRHGGPLLSLRCSARVRHCLRSLVRMVDWCVSRKVRLIFCRIILTASNKGRLF